MKAGEGEPPIMNINVFLCSTSTLPMSSSIREIMDKLYETLSIGTPGDLPVALRCIRKMTKDLAGSWTLPFFLKRIGM